MKKGKIDWEAVTETHTAKAQEAVSTLMQHIMAEMDEEGIGSALSEEQLQEMTNLICARLDDTMRDNIAPLAIKLSELKERVEAKAEVREISVTLQTGKRKQTTLKDEPVHYRFKDLMTMLQAGVNIALIGEAGSGKTFGAEQAARALKLECYMMSFHAKMTPTDLRGYCNAHGDYIESPIYKAYKNGGVLVLDEFDRSNTEVVVSLNNLLAGGSYTFPNAEKVAKHKDFLVIACMNTTGNGSSKQYRSASAQDASTLNRFCKIAWDIDEHLEFNVAGDTPCTRAVQAIRRNARECAMTDMIISPRQSIDVNKLCAAGMSLKDAVDAAILCGLAEDKQHRLLNGVTL